MSTQIKFLKYLRSIGADIEPKNVTKKLDKLGLKSENHIYDFLNPLAEEKYVIWEDNRPRNPDDMVIMGIPDQKAPFNFTAKLTLKGINYIDDRTIKTGSNKVAIAAAVIGLVSLFYNFYQGYISSNKDKIIDNLQKDLSSVNLRFDSLLNENKKLKSEILIAKKPLEIIREDTSKRNKKK